MTLQVLIQEDCFRLCLSGFSAEYMSLFAQGLDTEKIVAVKCLNKHQVGGVSPRTEPEAIRLVLHFLEDHGIKIA